MIVKYHLMARRDNYRELDPFWKRLVLIVLNFIVIFGFGFAIPASTVLAEENLMASISGAELTALVNRERLNNNRPALEPNDLLQKAAELKANDMAKRGYFSHDTPDGKLPWYWLNQAGYKYEAAGENLTTNIFESSEAVKAWMNSPRHRENILNKEYTQVGTAVVQGVFEGEETVFAVQFFGTPKEVFPVKKISSKPKTAVVSPKKVVKTLEKKIIPPPEPIILAQEDPKIDQYPRIFYTYDNGVECVIV